MPTFTYTRWGRSFVRSSVVLLAVAGMGYVAGAVSHSPASTRGVSAAFASPALGAEFNFRDPPPMPGVIAPAIPAELGQPGVDYRQDPRECDLAQGISTACLFMD